MLYWQTPNTMRQILPTDSALQTTDLDPDLGFLDGYVQVSLYLSSISVSLVFIISFPPQEALGNGAPAYLDPQHVALLTAVGGDEVGALHGY